jgi:trk system potassium uptake protein TrkA
VIISTGKDSHASILITMYVSELGAKRIVVKANTRDHAKILMQVGATQAIIPEQEMAVKVSRSLAQPNLIDFLPMTGDYYVAELEAPEDFHNKNLAELQLRSKYNVQLIAVRKNNRRFEFAPGGDYVVEKNDLLIILGQDEDINRLKG